MQPIIRETRGRASTRRSRFGCRNCKLRKLKCDEAKPQCKKCTSYGVVCNIAQNVPDLQPAQSRTSPLAMPMMVKPRPPVTSAVWTADNSTLYQLDTRCQDFVNRYLSRNLLSPGDPHMAQVNGELLKLAFTHPYLMHASLAVALAYDRHANSSLPGHRSIEECYHWTQSTTLFNQRLMNPIETKDKDPIWGTAAALSILACSSPDACVPEAAWPMNASQPLDLGWLSIMEGKMSLWRLTNPLRRESLFSVLAPRYAQMYLPLPKVGIENVPMPLAAVCKLDDFSTAVDNPYFEAAHALSHLTEHIDEEVTPITTQHFTRSIHGKFRALLELKDPVALLLLYLWYCKAGRSIWWIAARARVECRAIIQYLRVYHKENSAVHALL